MDRQRDPVRRRQIIDAAITVLAREGGKGFSLRLVAAELNLRAMALYYYFPNKNALLSAVLTEIGTVADLGPFDGPPRDRLLAQSCALFRAIESVPWVRDILPAGLDTSGPPLALMESWFEATSELGIDDSRAMGLWRSVWFILVGQAQWAGRDRSGDAGHWSSRINPDQLSSLPHVTRVRDSLPDMDAGYDVEQHIAALIDGTIGDVRGSGGGPGPTLS